MEKIFDSHSHYNNSAFSEDYDALMQHLKDSGVGYVMNCGSSVEAKPTEAAVMEAFPEAGVVTAENDNEADNLLYCFNRRSCSCY